MICGERSSGCLQAPESPPDGQQTGGLQALGFAAALMGLLSAVTRIICRIAGDGALLSRLMLETAPPETSGLPASAYPGVGKMMADYLTGRTDVFQYMLTDAAGGSIACFQPHEAAHMADCRGLISLAGTVALVSLILCTLCFGAGMLCCRERGRLRTDRRTALARGVRRGIWTAGGIASALLLWAALNFDGFFVTFHQVAFTNDGWLLNPRTDLLIRLMPERLFVLLGLQGLLRFAPVSLAMTAWAEWRLRAEHSERRTNPSERRRQ